MFRFTTSDRLTEVAQSEFFKYKDAFQTDDPDALDTACGELGAVKDLICHPNGPKSAPAGECRTYDTDVELDSKNAAWEECWQYRYLQNKSQCFGGPDSGHATAEKIAKSRVSKCRSVKQNRQLRRSHRRTSSRRRSIRVSAERRVAERRRQRGGRRGRGRR
jgi:hypothetical protein